MVVESERIINFQMSGDTRGRYISGDINWYSQMQLGMYPLLLYFDCVLLFSSSLTYQNSFWYKYRLRILLLFLESWYSNGQEEKISRQLLCQDLISSCKLWKYSQRSITCWVWITCEICKTGEKNVREVKERFFNRNVDLHPVAGCF